MRRHEGTTIKAAALYLDGLTFSMPPPKRHHDIANALHDVIGDKVHGATQGFLTSDGDFVRREPAWLIADSAGQFKAKPIHPRQLFSEDIF